MAFEALPITLLRSLVSSRLEYAFASSISAGAEYEEVLEEEWFNNLSALEVVDI